MTENYDEICGESYDHDLTVLSDEDGILVEECRECGAEIITDVWERS